MNRKIFLTLVAGVSLAVSLQAADYRWVSAAPDKNFLTAANWSPAVNPVQAPAPTPPVINEFMVRNFSTAGAAIINSDITIASGAINAGGDYGSTVGVINILSGNITCNRIQSGMRNTAGIINIYDGAINLVGMPSMIETTGALRIYYGGAINFYGGTIEMDYALYVSTNCTLNMFNVGAYAKAPNAAHAPIFANLGLDDSSLKVENGMLNLSLATGLNLEVGHVIYLIEYKGMPPSRSFKNLPNGSTVTIDGFRFRFEFDRQIAASHYAIALVALETVDTRLQKGTVIMISKL